MAFSMVTLGRSKMLRPLLICDFILVYNRGPVVFSLLTRLFHQGFSHSGSMASVLLGAMDGMVACGDTDPFEMVYLCQGKVW